MVHQSYHSKIRHGIIKVGLLPYEDTLISELARLKQEREDRRAHKIDGYYTRSQAVEELKMLGVCKETLAKWDKAGKLVPKRINGIRYYTKDDLKTAAKLFLDSPSPRVKDKKDQFLSLVKERNLSLAEAF
jgi:hypothetical protein